ncbi:MAG: rod-binding protein [Lachnospiraceae bacterium]|nr:rod-binding protein [Lachnospiraceae bacterium]
MDALTNQLYSKLSADQLSNTTSRLQSGLDRNYSKATDDELMDVCKEFESYFIEQMFKNMEKMVPKSEMESNYAASISDYYKEELIKDYSAQAVKNGQGLGLAQKLYEQMKRNYNL